MAAFNAHKANGDLDVGKVVTLLWKHKEDGAKVGELGALLCEFARKKTVMNEIEYYLPQLCHMMIHLESAWESQALEKFGFAVSQTSLHTALQLSFYLRAAMEDYQPEDANEMPNPAANHVLFYRCARLLQNMERAVVFGSPILQIKDEKQIAKATPEVLLATINAEKKSRADVILAGNKANELLPIAPAAPASLRRGTLLFKRNTRKSALQSKSWKPRFFRVEQQVLFCLRKEGDVRPLRAMSLQGCRVSPGADDAKHAFSFEVTNAAGMRFQLRAESQQSFAAWVALLSQEAGNFGLSEAPRPEGDYSPQGCDSIDAAPEHMSSTQRKRAYFFRRQVAFTDALTDICEALRSIPKDDRKFFLVRDLKDLQVPPFCYVPMCRSCDTFAYILKPLANECHAFTTKARVPALMHFEVEEHPKDVDVMTFLDAELQEYPDGVLLADSVEVVASGGDESVSTKLATSNTGASRINATIDSRSPRVSTAGRSSSLAAAPAAIVSTSTTIPELFSQKLARLKADSSFQHLPQWNVRGLIAKSNDDVRQEVFVMQLIEFYQRAFAEAKLPLWIYTYTILSTSKSTGLIELIPDAYSIDSIKKRSDFPGSLRLYYEQLYGAPDAAGVEPASLKTALTEYVHSMAAYSVVCYLLAIKDRHHGNIMIDTQGHVIHIDFGFVFGLAPGKAFSMEARVPWKLNKEMVEVMGGLKSPYYAEYASLCTQALLCARKSSQDAVSLMEILTYKSNFPAFRYNPSAIEDFKARMWPQVPDAQLEKQVQKLLYSSYNNSGSDLYDDFQLLTNKIAK